MTWKFKQIKPQKARGKYHEGLWADSQWLAEEKYDGERRIAQFCGSIVRFTGCRESVDGSGYVEKSEQVPHLDGGGRHRAKAAFFNSPNTAWAARNKRLVGLDGTVLDGEMVPPPGTKIQGGGSKYVTSIMGSSPEEAIRKQKERGFLCYKVFDCLWWKGQEVWSMILEERRTFVERAVKEWKNSYVSMSAGFSKETDKRKLYEHAAEGVVFKHIDHEYGDEKLWVKRKKAWTADVVVMGFTQGKGKYKGQIGAIEFSQYSGGPGQLVKVGKCSGMDDAQRDSFTLNCDDFIGRVIEITHNGREPSGKFRHPQFSRFRPDKNPKDCVYNPEET